MGDFKDLYLRQSVLQTTPSHAGGTASPDILPWGPQPNADPRALASLQSWKQDPGVGLTAGADNYVYVRTKNAGAVERPCRIFLAAAAPSYLCWPDTLVPIMSKSGQPYVEMRVAAGDIGVAAEGWVYRPRASGHTLAAWVFTAEHPVRPPNTRNISDLMQFMMATPGYAQRSIGYGLSGGSYRFRAGYEQRDTPAVVLFELVCTNCPSGWTVWLLPKSGGSDVTLGPFTLTAPDAAFMCERDLPAGFHTELEFGIDTAGIAALPGTELEVRVLLKRDVGAGSTNGPGTQVLLQLGGHRWRPG